jgi:hypothetical protein
MKEIERKAEISTRAPKGLGPFLQSRAWVFILFYLEAGIRHVACVGPAEGRCGQTVSCLGDFQSRNRHEDDDFDLMIN